MSDDVENDALQGTVGKIPVVGGVVSGAIEGASIGAAVATVAPVVVGIGTAVAASAASSVAGAATAIGVGSAIGNAIPIPGVGAAIGAFIGAMVAMGTAISAGQREDFVTSAPQAKAILELFRASPGLIFTGLDNSSNPQQGAYLVRILMVRSGEAGVDIKNGDAVNAYLAKPDPKERLTDPSYLTGVFAKFNASKGTTADYSTVVAPSVMTPTEARAVLAALRIDAASTQFAVQSLHSGDSQSLRDEIKAVRRIAGEFGPDPVLGAIVGDVSLPEPPPPPAKSSAFALPALPSFPSLSSNPMFWWGAAGVVVLLAVVGGVVVAQKRGVIRFNSFAPATKPRVLETPGDTAFRDVVFHGVNDGELQYSQFRMDRMTPFHKTFGDAKILGISPTELAVSGRFFGEEVLPIRIEIHADGSKHLTDGRRRYTAAKYAGASSILADVLLYDITGDIIAERRLPVRLI